LEEFHCEVFVGGVVIGEPQRHLQHVEAEFRHPGGTVRLFQDVAIWEHLRTVERADVVEPEEAALEHVIAARIFSIYPPGEVDQKLVEGPRQEIEIDAAIDLEHRERGPCLNRRGYVAEIPFIRRQLTVRMHEPFARQQQQLMLRRRRIDMREYYAMEGKVP